jgi:N-acetyl-gamma-glutamyl-phosphate reductase
MNKVFIDGSAGTTGLRIVERLSKRSDIELVKLPEELRKDASARKDAINGADIVFLCLPDDAARESAAMVENDHTVIIDTSTAHRTADGWTYGFPEIGGRREAIKTSKKIANPGCHASGFISLVAPLTETGVIKPDTNISCFSLTGYSGGGKKMIADYENPQADPDHMKLLTGPRMYGLSQSHKHLPEMAKVCGLANAPIFCPIVGNFYAGMEVTVQLFAGDVSVGIEEIKKIYADYYKDGLVKYAENADESGFVSAAAFAGRDDMQVSVFGNDERILLVSRFDNLGKGASGAAIQNMNLVMGIDETTGLVL